MRWLFERTIELAAWAALIAAWISAVLSVWWLVDWVGTLRIQPDYELLCESGKAAAAFVGFSVALGALASIDRFIFDADESGK
ncbi:MAG: hypothetical protein L0Z07_08965 [Planctomycetes bacterium]|nr:hypothetical protein [Planctomycetota bacterium]